MIRTKRSRRPQAGVAAPAPESPVTATAVQPQMEGTPPAPGVLDLAQIGRALREARERTGQPVEVIADALCIRPAYLTALERGDAGVLPGRTYALGFIRAYAQALGLRADRVVEEARIALDRLPAMRRYAPPRETVAPSRTLGLGLAAGLALVTLVGWALLAGGPAVEPDAAAEGAAETIADIGAEATAEPTRGAVPAAVAEDPTPAAPPLSPPTTPAAEPAVPVSGAAPQLAAAADDAVPAGTRVVLEAIEPAWIQVRSPDRAFVHTGTLQAGQRFEVPDRTDLALWTGNAGGLVVRVDGQALPPLGPSGGVVRQFALDPDRLLAATAGTP